MVSARRQAVHVCMYVYACTVYVYTRVCVCVGYTYLYAYMYIHTCTHIYTLIEQGPASCPALHRYACVYVCMIAHIIYLMASARRQASCPAIHRYSYIDELIYLHTYIFTCITFIHIFMYVCVYTYTYIYIYIYIYMIAHILHPYIVHYIASVRDTAEQTLFFHVLSYA